MSKLVEVNALKIFSPDSRFVKIANSYGAYQGLILVKQLLKIRKEWIYNSS